MTKKNDNASPEILRRREKDLFKKQTAYWRKNWGLICETEEQFREITENSKEIKRVLDIMPLIQSLKFEYT
jgi:hypothetical protein